MLVASKFKQMRQLLSRHTKYFETQPIELIEAHPQPSDGQPFNQPQKSRLMEIL